MKHYNPNTRNIFTKRGRLNRRIAKHQKLLDKINKLNIELQEIKEENNEIAKFLYDTQDDNECIICCDGCSHEFDITDDVIEKRKIDSKDGLDCEEYLYVCPMCGFENSVEYDDTEEQIGDIDEMMDELIDDISDNIENIESDEESKQDIDNSEEVSESDKEEDIESNSSEDSNETETESDNDIKTDNIVEINTHKIRSIEIKNKNTKNHKVIVSTNNPIKLITDNDIITSINVVMDNKPILETISILKNKNINLVPCKKDGEIIGYATDSKNISLLYDEDDCDKEYIGLFVINTKLSIVPHGNHINIFNSILSQLGISKFDNRYESVGLGGKACLIKLNDGTVAACNFKIDNDDLIMSIINDIDSIDNND